MRLLLVRMLAGLLVLFLALPSVVGAEEMTPAENVFQGTWARTDLPIAEGRVARSWIWGPEPFTEVIEEPYVESPGGQREVQYFDKARMEVTTPVAITPWYVTTGLLATELISGEMQVGDYTFEQRLPSEQNIAGDQGFANGPSYGTFGTIYGLHMPSTGDRVGDLAIHRVARDGFVTEDVSLAERGVELVYYDDVTEHNIAAPFWDFMHASGLIWDGQQYVEDSLFLNPFYATGRPISEPYWADVQVGGTTKLVLMQCFERRCLTYTPDNPEAWQVEMGNIGQHYYAWRYATPPTVDGDLLIFRHEEDTAPGSRTTNLYRAGIDGSDLVNLSEGIDANYGSGLWSPDGQYIAFDSRDANLIGITSVDGAEQWVVNIEGAFGAASWRP